MASDIGNTLNHVSFLSRHFHGDDIPCRAIIVLLDLGIPTNRDGFDYLKNAIVLRYIGPSRAASKELYPEVGRCYDPEADYVQVEQAIRSAIKDAWKNRDERVWGYYFADRKKGLVKCPTNLEFITRIVYILVLWQGCCKEAGDDE